VWFNSHLIQSGRANLQALGYFAADLRLDHHVMVRGAFRPLKRHTVGSGVFVWTDG
jgi:hypothetical protein